MALLRNTAEGQASGTALTVGNSGGSSGDAFNAITLVGTGTILFDSAQKMHGTKSYHVQAPVGTDTAKISYTIASTPSAALCFYMRLNSLPGAGHDIGQLRASAATGGKVGISTLNKLTVSTMSGVLLSTFATALVAGTWYRIELQVIPGTTSSNGTIAGAYYLGDSTTAQDTAYSSASVDAGIVPLIQCIVGKLGVTNTLDAHFDEISWNPGSTSPIGPTPQLPTAVLSTSLTNLTVNADASGSSAISPATISTYRFNWGDGTADTVGGSATASHTYSATGTYRVTLTVTDSLGAVASTFKMIVFASTDVYADAYDTVTLATGTWTQVSGPTVTLTGGNSFIVPAFTSDTTLVFTKAGVTVNVYVSTHTMWRISSGGTPEGVNLIRL